MLIKWASQLLKLLFFVPAVILRQYCCFSNELLQFWSLGLWKWLLEVNWRVLFWLKILNCIPISRVYSSRIIISFYWFAIRNSSFCSNLRKLFIWNILEIYAFSDVFRLNLGWYSHDSWIFSMSLLLRTLSFPFKTLINFYFA